MLLITALQAAGAPMQPTQSLMDMMFMPLIILVVFYFFLIRPQQKKVKDHRELVSNVRRGDQVVTSGGLLGKVAKVSEDEVLVDLGDNVRVRVVKHTLSDIRSKSEPAKSDEDKKAK